MNFARYDVVVVGAGIAGLTAAWRLRHRQVRVLEAGTRVGGRIRSEPRAGYWLNLGAHLFGDDHSPAGRLVREMGLEARPIPGDRMGIAFGGKVVAGGRPETYPLRLPLTLPGRLSFAKMGLKLQGGVRKLLEVQRPIPAESALDRRLRQLSFDNDRSLHDFVGRLSPEVDLMLRTLTERTSARPDEMAAGYGLTSFGQVWSKHSFGRNLFGGSARLPQSLAERLDGLELDADVRSVVAEPDGVEITYRRNSEIRKIKADHVVMATPAHVTCAITRGLPEATMSALRKIRYGPFLSVALLTAEQAEMPWDRNYAIATPGLSFGVFFNQASTLRMGTRQPGGSLMLFRGAEEAARFMDGTDTEIEQRFIHDLEALFPESRGIVKEVIVQRWPQGAPFSFVGRAALQPALTGPFGRLHLAGDYLEFPCMDAAIVTAEEAAAAIDAALSTGRQKQSGDVLLPSATEIT